MIDKWDSALKFLPPDRLKEMAPRLARPLVFTNGVFDILHAGHVAYLEAASAQGSCLIVALNSDESARGLGKPGDRPFNTLKDRARVVGALGCVSWVTCFDEPTPEALLAALRPDVYVKGGDYRVEDLPETPLVRAWGGRVSVGPFLEGRSSTQLIEHLRAGAP
ncbi:adenylyltransferase/cytidyltransferase family protein [Roseateles sp.]|uniref:adenylyltransferase/cytidyltransferase family protein n=1 Tax=Roseateles sp. TaxID=1971397 RepID=UPI0031DE22EC